MFQSRMLFAPTGLVLRIGSPCSDIRICGRIYRVGDRPEANSPAIRSLILRKAEGSSKVSLLRADSSATQTHYGRRGTSSSTEKAIKSHMSSV
jgi:hypothetical protein